MKTYHFPTCGCSIPIDEGLPDIHGHPSLIYPDDVNSLNLNCDTTWDMLGQGSTKGVFQLESPLGRQWTKRIKPRSIEHLAAEGALLRPGCVSGDTTISLNFYDRPGCVVNCRKMKIRELYQKFTRNHFNGRHRIVSLEEKTNVLFENGIEAVTYSGKKPVYKVKVDTRGGKGRFYNLECTLNHKLLTLHGWVELKDVSVGTRIAVIRCRKKLRPSKQAPGESSFRSICLAHYQYHCVFCDWAYGSLDVNHLDGNRRSNNGPDNLCFLCPNHHRMYSEGNIPREVVIQARKKYKLPNSNHIEWRIYRGKTKVSVTDTYDISVAGPNHNFIAGNVVVHNCLKAKDEEGVSMTEHYALRKNGLEPVTYFHPALEPILNTTFGVLTYQEQAMAIAVVLAGFTPQEADDLRKAIGKKKTDVMAKVKQMSTEKAAAVGIVTPEEWAEIFGWIEKSQRYSFNKSHAVSYALIGYHTAHAKAHFPLQFFTSFLYHAKEKQDPLQEVRQLVNDAKTCGIEVMPPRFKDLKYHFNTDGVVITFGLADVKGIGKGHVAKMRTNAEIVEKRIGTPRMEWGWFDFLVYFSPACTSNVVKRMIEVGAMRDYPVDRQRQLAEYEAYNQLTEKEQHKISQLKSGEHDQEGFLIRKPLEVNNITDAIEALLDMPKGVANKNRRDKVATIFKMLKTPPRPLVDTPEWIAKTEQECLGIPITCNRVDGTPNLKANTTCKEFRDGKDVDPMILAVDVQECREVRIQNGDNRGKLMAFLTITDNSGSLEDVCMFSDAWEKYGNLIYPGCSVELLGRRDYRRGSLIVEEAWKL